MFRHSGPGHMLLHTVHKQKVKGRISLSLIKVKVKFGANRSLQRFSFGFIFTFNIVIRTCPLPVQTDTKSTKKALYFKLELLKPNNKITKDKTWIKNKIGLFSIGTNFNMKERHFEKHEEPVYAPAGPINRENEREKL